MQGLVDLLHAGRRKRRAALTRICRVLPARANSVTLTESAYRRWRLRAMVIAKFVPGLSALTAALAGSQTSTASPVRHV